MTGVFASRIPVKYEGNDNDIKVISVDLATRTATSGFNPEPAGAKNDADKARQSGGSKRRGQRARYGIWKGTSNGVDFNKRVAILTKTVYSAMEVAAGDPGVTTYNFTYKGVAMVLMSVHPEVNA